MRGEERESTLGKEIYFSEHYFSMAQLGSFSHQLHEIYRLKPGSVLEIGIGNGFTSSFLRRAGIDVYTVDINPHLEPDLVSSIDDLPDKLINRQFDLVVCCEVLEHTPFENFEESIRIFSQFSHNLFLTLPSYQTWIGFSGFVRIPKLKPIPLSLGLLIRRHKQLEKSVHFWELGSQKSTSRSEIKKILLKYYKKLNHHRFHLNRYHECFICMQE